MSALTPEHVQILVDNHRRFRTFLEQRVGNRADAEDILQAAFAKGIEKGHMIRHGERLLAWFYRLLRNAVVDHYRHRDAESRALARLAGLHDAKAWFDPAFERAVCQCMHALLPTLPTDYATLLRRVDLEDASIAVVAAETGLSPNNVRVKLHRARNALRKALEQSCGTCTEHGCLDCTCRTQSHHSGGTA